MRTALERRQMILEVLSDRRRDTVANLAIEFGVSNATIRRDITVLTCSAPIFTMQGGGGGIRVASGWYVGRRYMRMEQEKLLRDLLPGLQPEQQSLIQDLLTAFAKPIIKGE